MKIIALLRLPKPVKSASAFAKSVVTAITNNPSFPAPTPSIATLDADIAALDAAEAVVLTRAKGSAEARDVKLAAVKVDLEHLLAYVQQVADANPSTAESIIQSAGMSVKKVGVRAKSDLTAELGSVSGSLKLIAKAAANRASYEWHYSTDQKTWTNAPVTLQARTVLAGLTPAVIYFFRFRPVTRVGEGDWSQVVSLLVK